MPVAPGARLGPYEVVGALGAGGMGEVYRAKDTRLNREVAIKVLPEHLSANPDLKARFDREAKAISSLQHPHICVLHDVGSQDGVDFLVMELIDGETLAERLARKPLSLAEALRIAIEVAGALEKAHRCGIVHRDLKPGNIMLTRSGSKLMDFGLAKPSFLGAGTASSAPAFSATMTSPAAPITMAGTVVGTVQYMSPEQIQGKEADARSDIFAFGSVLYEMLTGKRAFDGKSQLSVASAILEKEPEPISAVKPIAPAALDHVVKRALEKDPDSRWQSAIDLAGELEWIAENAGHEKGLSSGSRSSQRAAWALAAISLVMLFVAAALWWDARNRDAAPMYFNALVPFAASDVALSPDGRTLAMTAYSPEANNTQVWVHAVGKRETTPLDGTDGAAYPFWSGDGRFIGFFADGKLKKVDASGKQVQLICDAPNGRGGAWNSEGVILFTPDALGTGLYRVSAAGGTPVEITKLDPARTETTHRWPQFLPDGRHFLFLGANFSGRSANNAIFVGALDSTQKQLVIASSANAAYAETGHLIYRQDNNTLVAQRFDTKRYTLSGDSHFLTDDVLYFPGVDKAAFSVGGDVLVTQSGKGASLSQMTWFDRSGRAVGKVGGPGAINNVRISPDGRRVATDQTDADGRNIDLWIYEPERSAATRLTFDPGLDQNPVWGSDGKRILFSSNRRLGFDLFAKNSDGSGTDEKVLSQGNMLQHVTWDWSRDGKYLLTRKDNELWYFAWSDLVPKPLAQGKFAIRNAQFSPDGRWVAYATNETGNWEVYVSPFPSFAGKWQVSPNGGQEPKWRGDGKELFYVSTDGKIMSVGVAVSPNFQAGTPSALFQINRRRPVSAQDLFSYDVSADGQRFLVIAKIDEGKTAPLSVFLNWAEGIEK